MCEGILKNGAPSKEELASCPGCPSEERTKKGPVAVIECVQEIPCNPCEASCPRKAIEIGENITRLPSLDEEKCIGCGICISNCPGLAIFVVDKAYSKTEATVEFPFEYNFIPKKGDIVEAVNRQGQVVCKGNVLSVRNPVSNNRTPIIKISIPKVYADEVRSIKRRKP